LGEGVEMLLPSALAPYWLADVHREVVMRMSLVMLTAAILAGASSQVSAQQSKPSSEKTACWEMSAPMKELTPFVLILLDKCTGRSWNLTRFTVSEPTAAVSGHYAYRWVPLDGDVSQAVPVRP
jgi:hypothetical protein